MDTGNGMPTPLLFMKFTTDLQNRVMNHIILLRKEAKKASLFCVDQDQIQYKTGSEIAE